MFFNLLFVLYLLLFQDKSAIFLCNHNFESFNELKLEIILIRTFAIIVIIIIYFVQWINKWHLFIKSSIFILSF